MIDRQLYNRDVIWLTRIPGLMHTVRFHEVHLFHSDFDGVRNTLKPVDDEDSASSGAGAPIAPSSSGDTEEAQPSPDDEDSKIFAGGDGANNGKTSTIKPLATRPPIREVSATRGSPKSAVYNKNQEAPAHNKVKHTTTPSSSQSLQRGSLASTLLLSLLLALLIHNSLL